MMSLDNLKNFVIKTRDKLIDLLKIHEKFVIKTRKKLIDWLKIHDKKLDKQTGDIEEIARFLNKLNKKTKKLNKRLMSLEIKNEKNQTPL